MQTSSFEVRAHRDRLGRLSGRGEEGDSAASNERAKRESHYEELLVFHGKHPAARELGRVPAS